MLENRLNIIQNWDLDAHYNIYKNVYIYTQHQKKWKWLQ